MALNTNLKKKLNLRIEKEEMDDFVSRVGFACDVSGSMSRLYGSGYMSNLNEILLPLAVEFDDNREMDMVGFNSDILGLPPMDESNYVKYVDNELIGQIGGGTDYHPPLTHFVENWFDEYKTKDPESFFAKIFSPKQPPYVPQNKQVPGYIIFQSDGQLSDYNKTWNTLKFINKNLNCFITFIGIGSQDDFAIFDKATKEFDNVNSFYLTGRETEIDSDALYDSLVNDKVRNFFFKGE